jgi:hypothetical protein
VNEPTQGVGTHQSQQPKDQQNNSNVVQHGNFSFRVSRQIWIASELKYQWSDCVRRDVSLAMRLDTSTRNDSVR